MLVSVPSLEVDARDPHSSPPIGDTGRLPVKLTPPPLHFIPFYQTLQSKVSQAMLRGITVLILALGIHSGLFFYKID